MSLLALEASGVRKVYAKDGQSLEVLNVEQFSVREGELITVIGRAAAARAPSCTSSALHQIRGGGSIRVYGEEVDGPARTAA